MPLFVKRKPAFRLTGLVASPDGLYDGSFVVACAGWWNHEVGSRPDMSAYRLLTDADVRRLCRAVQPENRRFFEAVASGCSLHGRHSTAVLCLAYALALVVDAGAIQALGEDERATRWTQAPPFTETDVTELQRHYSQEGATRRYELWPPYWMASATAFDDRIGPTLISSARTVFDDQVDRWAAAEGEDLRSSIGAPDYTLVTFGENVEPANFVQLLFEWGGRLRLGERLRADGVDLTDIRFSYDDSSYIERLYQETLERYLELNTQPSPVDEDVALAVRCGVNWLGDGKDEPQRLAVSAAAVRGYLWRTVENSARGLLEPELSQAVERSRTVGDDRGPDEPIGITLYYAASQCMTDDVQTWLGSLGGLVQGRKSFEKAFYDTTRDFEEQGLKVDETTRRLAFHFGVCLFDVEQVLKRTQAPN